MGPTGLVAALAGAVIMLGLWLSGFALGQTQTEDKGAGAPAAAPTAPTAPATPSQAQAQPDDLAGQEVTMIEQPIVYLSGTAKWDSAFETIIDSFKKVYAYLEKEKIAPAGPAMTIYTSTDDTGFEYQAGVPVAEEPKAPVPDGLFVGKSPEGKALKFIHRGSYDAMDSTYEAITNHLDEKRLEAKDLFIEEYITDPLKTAEDKLVINVYVPLK